MQEPPNWRTLPIGESPEAQQALIVLIGTLHAVQNTYNAPATYLEPRIAVFKRELAGYSFEVIDNACSQHIRQSPNVPTVNHILNIINPPPPVFTPITYYTLKRKKRDNGWLTNLEEESCRFFEQQELAKVQQMKDWQKRQQELGRSTTPVIDHDPTRDWDAGEEWNDD